jgi:DNA-binding CsgD family transcriptional regulator
MQQPRAVAKERTFQSHSRPGRKSRAKLHHAWEVLDFQSHGLYSTQLESLTKRFPLLSPMELRVTALIKTMYSSRQIAERLSICEETVHNHRSSIRHKIGIGAKESLQKFLLKL